MLEQRKPVEGQMRLVADSLEVKVNTATRGLVITLYRVYSIDVDESVGTAGFRLRKIAAGSIYDVVVRPWGPECDCPDFINCRMHKDPKGCKHIAALRKANLI